MLAGTLALHDLRDTEALATHVVITSSRFQFSPTEREDLTAYLIATAWELSLRYEPGAVGFASWVTARLRLRVIDWVRAERGRTRWRYGNGRVHERERRVVESLEDRVERGLFEPVGRGGLDRGGVGLSDQLRALRARSSPPAGYHRRVGEGSARRAG